MKRLLTLLFVLPLFASGEEKFDAKTAPFMQLFQESQRAPDTAEHAAWRESAYNEMMARGAETLSNLMERIHIENPMLGTYAITITRDRPVPKDDAMRVLTSFYTAERHVTRRMAAFLSGFYDAPEYAEKILPLLDHDKTRGAAVRALGKWRVTNALPRIEKILAGDPKERIRVAAANALRDIGDPRSIEPLITALGDTMWSVRNTAARALVSFGPEAVTPVMARLELANNLDNVARRQLVRCLGDLKDKRAVFLLRKLADEADAATRTDAQHALDLISGQRDDVWFGPGGE